MQDNVIGGGAYLVGDLLAIKTVDAYDLIPSVDYTTSHQVQVSEVIANNCRRKLTIVTPKDRCLSLLESTNHKFYVWVFFGHHDQVIPNESSTKQDIASVEGYRLYAIPGRLTEALSVLRSRHGSLAEPS